MVTSQFAGFLNTPPLWQNKLFGIQQFEFPKVTLNLLQPKALPDNLRLGHQIEYVFKQLVESSKAYDLVLHNLPIRQEKRTLGEIDFILKDNTNNALIHVELTYKFYIIDLEISDPIHKLIGPNKRDTFFLKKEKIKNLQFPLLHSKEGANALRAINIDHKTIEHQCCFKAQLFQPYSSVVDIGPLNRDCLAGYWIRFDEFSKSTFVRTQYYIPTKSEWVIDLHDLVNWTSHDEIMAHVKLNHLQEFATMLWLKKSNNEFEKLFVVWW